MFDPTGITAFQAELKQRRIEREQAEANNVIETEIEEVVADEVKPSVEEQVAAPETETAEVPAAE